MENKRQLAKVTEFGSEQNDVKNETVPLININSIDKMSLESLRDFVETLKVSDEPDNVKMIKF